LLQAKDWFILAWKQKWNLWVQLYYAPPLVKTLLCTACSEHGVLIAKLCLLLAPTVVSCHSSQDQRQSLGCNTRTQWSLVQQNAVLHFTVFQTISNVSWNNKLKILTVLRFIGVIWDDGSKHEFFKFHFYSFRWL
jgi:hypothetical protein